MANIRVQEAARYVCLSKSSLDKLRCFGGGPQYLKIGRSVVYDTDDLDAWLQSKRRASTWANDNNAVIAALAKREKGKRNIEGMLRECFGPKANIMVR